MSGHVSRDVRAVLVAAVLALGMTLIVSGAASADDAASFRDIKLTPERKLSSEQAGHLRADAQEIADLLKIAPLVERLRAQQQAGSSRLPPTRAFQNARLLCLWKIFIASQEVRKVVATINYDLSRSNQALDSLTSKRDMTINMLNTFNFMQSGILGTIKQGGGFEGRHQILPAARQEIGMTFFGTGTGLAAINLLIPPLWSRKIETTPNILVHVFDPSYRPADAEQSYLWKFMNSPIPGSNLALTRRQILIRHWEAFAGLKSKDERRLKKLAAAPSDSERFNESIRIISQRMDLLHDLRTHIEEFDTALYELHQAVTLD